MSYGIGLNSHIQGISWQGDFTRSKPPIRASGPPSFSLTGFVHSHIVTKIQTTPSVLPYNAVKQVFRNRADASRHMGEKPEELAIKEARCDNNNNNNNNTKGCALRNTPLVDLPPLPLISFRTFCYYITRTVD
ncbi:hypothetical protein VOLCADRAFT_97773 [Volvox carteri f. nagariensis]|uniref:Uncharacterized protein n=1 Tax=Volvox carteri f. nagariensis TaxID=3068 RepID=D8UDL4_VOLCA|nr:uncharacterized protein VOLCADRAFT_97773 [Volvox carteri f. nagariensis]EFJ42214.1 hypothetical protein VOLCADRAFT_97773 [Volvox carteri f. nagariensis]|eukprot:XP_002956757.1 hypothetical protein VOLCADRAFT_97773 [Volvox carteri f. nagariensis]